MMETDSRYSLFEISRPHKTQPSLGIDERVQWLCTTTSIVPLHYVVMVGMTNYHYVQL